MKDFGNVIGFGSVIGFGVGNLIGPVTGRVVIGFGVGSLMPPGLGSLIGVSFGFGKLTGSEGYRFPMFLIGSGFVTLGWGRRLAEPETLDETSLAIEPSFPLMLN